MRRAGGRLFEVVEAAVEVGEAEEEVEELLMAEEPILLLVSSRCHRLPPSRQFLLKSERLYRLYRSGVLALGLRQRNGSKTAR